MSFARNFRMGKEGKYVLQVRGEFQNIFNRLYLPTPSLANPAVLPVTAGGINVSGYGTIATAGGAGYVPRNGQAVIRFQF